MLKQNFASGRKSPEALLIVLVLEALHLVREPMTA